MRLFVTLVFFISLIVVPQFASANKATTIDELAAMYNIESCAECHEDTHNEWKNSWHGQSLTDSRMIRAWRTFILSGLDKKGMPRSVLGPACIKCHAPQVLTDATEAVATQIADLVVTAADDPDQAKKDAALKELGKLNINCLICHNMKAVPGGGAQAKTIYGPKGAEDLPHKEEIGFESMKSDYLEKAEFCAECHHGCPPGMPSSECPTLFTTYKEHYLAHGGDKTCQNCHMEKVDDVSSHKFPGVTDQEFVKKGVDIKVHAFPTDYTYHMENKIVPAVIFTAQITNTTGHGIPHG
jgi:hypothetical protein